MGEASDDVHDSTMTAWETQLQAILAVKKDCKYVFCAAGEARRNKDGLWECRCGTTFEL